VQPREIGAWRVLDKRVFGDHEADASISLCGSRISIVRVGGGCVYTRVCCRGSERSLDVPGCRVFIHPVQPLFYPERLTGYVMVKLPRPIVLPPGFRARLLVLVEYDVAVSVDGVHPVDVFTVGRGKYALYGPPSGGVLARYAEARIVGDSGEVGPAPWCGMLAEVTLHNESGSNVSVERIVYPAYGIPLYYRGEGLVYGPRLHVRVQSPFTARVLARGWEVEGFSPSPLHAKTSLAGMGPLLFYMRYGL